MPVACRGAQVAMCAGQAARRAAANNQNNGSMRKSVGGDQSMARRQPGKGAPKESPKKAEKEKPKTLPKRILMGVLDFLDQTWLQTLQYIVFLFAFQSLTATIRKSEEFYFDKYLTDTFINNPFDGDHNRLVDVRRISDIWEWKDRVLTPGLFSQAVEGEVWPDGDGASLLTGATPLSTADVVDTDNIVSITDGIIIKQTRAQPIEGAVCYVNHSCFDDGATLDASGDGGDRSSYGIAGPTWGANQFHYWSATDLGANPAGHQSASQLSYRNFPSGGFIAVFLPFFSETYLPDQAGTYSEVMDHRPHVATPSNGKAPTYYCARASFNGQHIEQRCNSDPSANDGVVRRLFEEMIDQLKKGHWVDHKTRLLSVTMQLRNNNAGVRFVARYMFEITQMGAVLPSYDMETLIDDDLNTQTMKMWMLVALGLTMWFAMLEAVELFMSGPVSYFTNLWNVMDWSNFGLFALVYLTLTNAMTLNDRDKALVTSGTCPARVCSEIGYYDMWEVFDTARSAKFYMSICVCIQLLKIIKFTNVIVPKMSLMTRVLAKGCYDLLFFGVIFGVSMFAFCMLFYIQLGSFMDDFYSQTSSIIALTKALFGDFPFEEIIDNSRGYVNGILFLVYLFVAVFILLSMFLAILGEAQAAVRDDEREDQDRGDFPNQYGFLGEMSEFVGAKLEKLKGGDKKEEGDDEGEAAEKLAQQQENPGLDSALNMALTKMQKKLDASVLNRMTSLEQRVVQRLSTLDLRLGDGSSPHRRNSSSFHHGSGRRVSHEGDTRSMSKVLDGGVIQRAGSGNFERAKQESPTRIVKPHREGSNERSHGSNEMKLADADKRPGRGNDSRSRSKASGSLERSDSVDRARGKSNPTRRPSITTGIVASPRGAPRRRSKEDLAC